MDCKESFSWVTVWGLKCNAVCSAVSGKGLVFVLVDIAPVQYKHRQKILELIEAMQELQLPRKMSHSEIEKKLAQKIHDTYILSFFNDKFNFSKR